jgi:hypothetical protein
MPTYNVTEIYHGRTWERDTNGITTTIIYCGSKTDCQGFADSQTIGTTTAGIGRLAAVSVNQADGGIYHVTLKYLNANGTSSASGQSVISPDYSFGTYSATMDGTMLSTPLEIHKNAAGQFDYKCCWNQYLIGKYAKGGTAPDAPAWWDSLGADPSTGVISPIPQAEQQTYQWSDYGTLPIEDGYEFVVLKTPTMAGYQSYDRCLYTLTESARYRTYANAVAAIAGKANKTGTPTNNPGSPFVNGNWKCDRAQVEWTGEFWRATLTWTYSPDGWNSTLYQAIS